MEYQVTITETLSRIELVEASSAIEAEDFVRDRYSKCDIVLNDTHFIGTNFETNQVVPNMSTLCHEEIDNISNYATFRSKIADIVKAEDTQTDCFTLREDLPAENLPFLCEEG